MEDRKNNILNSSSIRYLPTSLVTKDTEPFNSTRKSTNLVEGFKIGNTKVTELYKYSQKKNYLSPQKNTQKRKKAGNNEGDSVEKSKTVGKSDYSHDIKYLRRRTYRSQRTYRRHSCKDNTR